MNNPLYEHSDFCLRSSLYMTSKLLQDNISLQDLMWFEEMQAECRLDKWTGHRKSDQYHWSNSGSANPTENTLLQRPTYWIYHHILKYFNYDPHKGLNHDQYRAYFICLYLTNDWRASLKVMFGYIYRLGFTPSMMEHCLFKPQAYYPLLAVKFPYKLHYLWRPLYWISKAAFYIGKRPVLNTAPDYESTNKISLLPTLKATKQAMPNQDYIKKVYWTYWSRATDKTDSLIRDNLIKALKE